MFEKFIKIVRSPIESTSVKEVRKDLVVLIIMDGLGIHPDPLGNAVLQARTPFLDVAWSKGFSTLIHASGVHVGLPELENGNSEVGHLNIGSGQVVYQSLPRINDAIKNGTFHENPIIAEAIKKVKSGSGTGSRMHLMGVLSDGGVHGHIEHLFALLQICKDFEIDPVVHVFLDGRDTGLTTGYGYVEKLLKKFKDLGIGRIGSVSGRFYAMDRDKRWERTQMAYDAIRGTSKKVATDPLDAIKKAYADGENDQIFTPLTIVDMEGNPLGAVQDGDVALFYNFREDRARQLTKAFVMEDFPNIEKEKELRDLMFVTMTGYEDGLPTKVVFPPKKIEESLARAISNKGLKQLHISETEKYMHVTYFFNGGIEEPHAGEDFFNIPSPRVFDYSETPEMSAGVIRDEVIYRINRNKDFDYSFIIMNFANPDMLGHTGNLEQTIKANEFIDECVRDVATATLKADGCAIIIADHGNCETMINREDGTINTYHTNNPVPFILLSRMSQITHQPGDNIMKLGTGRDVPVSGLLADVAPTVLSVLGIETPDSMTGLDLLGVMG